jgi:hypothetical protein
MTSIAPTSTAVTVDELSSATNDGSSGFLKISPELRNRIYGYAFETVSSSGPIPHALTQVNQQIRGESRKTYYASVDCLVLPVRTLEQIRRTQKFLDEVGLSLYPMLPDIEFLSTTGNPIWRRYLSPAVEKKSSQRRSWLFSSLCSAEIPPA